MQLSIQNLNVQELHGTIGNVWLRLTKLISLTTGLTKEKGPTSLQHLSAKSGQLEIKIPIENGAVLFEQPIGLEGLTADLSFGTPFVGTARLDTVRAPKITLRIGAINASFELEATQVLFERLPIGETVLFFQTLTLKNVAAKNATLEASADLLSLRGLRVTFGKGSFQFTLPQAQLKSLSAKNKDLFVQAATLLFSENISFNKQTTSIGQVEADNLRATLAFSQEPKEDADKKPMPQLDLRILNGIEGKLDADIDVQIKVPVIGHRHAVHRIRLPIENGAINFIELKNNLAFLESSLLDFVVEGDQLILQRDIPLIPDTTKPIIFWTLDAEGQRLAAEEKVSLRNLPNARMASSDEPKDETKKSPLEFLKVHDLSLDIALFSQEAFTLDGVISKISAEKLTVEGSLHYVPEEATPPTAIEIQLKNLFLSLFRLPVGDKALDIRAVEVGAVTPCTLTMNGIKPASLEATLTQVKIRGLSHSSALSSARKEEAEPPTKSSVIGVQRV